MTRTFWKSNPPAWPADATSTPSALRKIVYGDLRNPMASGSRLQNPLQKRASKAAKSATKKAAALKSRSREKATLDGARPGKLPLHFQPQLATLAKSARAGDQWLHEVKFDGYRMLCRIDKGRVKLFTRNDLDWTKKLPGLVEAMRVASAASSAGWRSGGDGR